MLAIENSTTAHSSAEKVSISAGERISSSRRPTSSVERYAFHTLGGHYTEGASRRRGAVARDSLDALLAMKSRHNKPLFGSATEWNLEIAANLARLYVLL